MHLQTSEMTFNILKHDFTINTERVLVYWQSCVTSMNSWGSKCQTTVHVLLMGVVQVGAYTITLGHTIANKIIAF